MSRARSRRRERRNQASDVTARLAAAVPAVAFALFIIISGGWIFALGVLVLAYVCLHELFGMYRGVRPVTLAGFVGVTGLVAAAYFGGERQVLLAAAAFFPVLFMLALSMPTRERPPLTASMSLTLLGTFWIGLSVAIIVLLRELPHGEGIIILLLVATFIGDTGAYFAGRAFGARKLAPTVSPGKTVEGLVAGVFTAVVAGWAAGLYMDYINHGQALLLGLGAAVMAPIGDLFESKVKRDAGTKDAGTLFGAHGGALDRLDAALFTLVTGYYVWLVML